jgi:hypothetical protein
MSVLQFTAGQKAARTKKRRAAGRKAAETKRRNAASDRAIAFVAKHFDPVLDQVIENPALDPVMVAYTVVYDTVRSIVAELDNKDHDELNTAIWKLFDVAWALQAKRASDV